MKSAVSKHFFQIDIYAHEWKLDRKLLMGFLIKVFHWSLDCRYF
jgi:hypothetical protein